MINEVRLKVENDMILLPLKRKPPTKKTYIRKAGNID